MNFTNTALWTIVGAIVLVIVFFVGWRRANQRSLSLATEIAQKKALLADTSDRLLFEEQNFTALNQALQKANDTIAERDYEIALAREKIASLNGENNTIYTNYLAAHAELKTSSIELRYFQHFARLLLQNGRAHLEKVESLLREAVRSKRAPELVHAVEPMQLLQELLELVETDNLPERIRRMREAGRREIIHLVPRLRDFVAYWEEALGARFIARVPLGEKSVLFAGSWVHIELVVATLISNAVKHSVESGPIEFEFSSADHLATIQVTNWSAEPMPESVIRAKTEMVVGDLQQPRFGLHLVDQIASGYRAIVKLENIGTAPDGVSHVVRTSFSFALR